MSINIIQKIKVKNKNIADCMTICFLHFKISGYLKRTIFHTKALLAVLHTLHQFIKYSLAIYTLECKTKKKKNSNRNWACKFILQILGFMPVCTNLMFSVN